MEQLREKIAKIIDPMNYMGDGEAWLSLEKASKILDIPAIRDALALYEQWLDSPASPPLTNKAELRAWFAKVRPADPEISDALAEKRINAMSPAQFGEKLLGELPDAAAEDVQVPMTPNA